MRASWPNAHLADLIEDARPGFASGEDPADGVFQFRMNNLRTDGSFDLSRRRRVSRHTKNLDAFLLGPGDVLFNATNSPDLVGKSAYFDGCDEPAVFSNHFMRLRPKATVLDGRFLARWLQLQFKRRLFQTRCKQWVNQATFGRDALLALQMPIPPIEEQRRITGILDHADDLRTKRQRTFVLLNDLAESVFLDMFGDPVSNSRGWDRTALASLGTLDRGVSKHRPRNAPELLGGPYPLIQTGDVANSGGYITTFSSTYSDLGLRQSKMWPRGTLCITIAANIAKTGLLTFEACFPDSVVGFSSSTPGMSAYVRSLLGFHQKRLETLAPESAQKNINLKVLRELQVPRPTDGLIERFASVIENIRAIELREATSAAHFDDLFASIQDRAFSGLL